MRFILLITIVLPAAWIRAQNAEPQERASTYMYAGHWAKTYVRLLRDRGYLPSLNPSVEPYERLALASAVRGIPRENLPEAERYWVSLLEKELALELAVLDAPTKEDNRLEVRATGGLPAYRQKNKNRIDGRLDPEVNVALSRLAVGTRGTIDNGLLHDKGYTGYKTSFAGARVTDGYGLIRFQRLYFFVGRFAENWSPFPDHSLVLSDHAYTYDKIGLGFDTRHLSFRSFFAKLDNAYLANRYLSAHRFDLRFNNGMTFGFTETVVHGSTFARNRPLELAYLNPFGIFADVQLNDRKEANENVAIDAYVPIEKFNFRGQFLIDDFILDGADKPAPNRKTSPDRLGFLFGVQSNDWLVVSTQFNLQYERIGSYTYNLKLNRPWQSYTFMNRGLGNPANDRDEWTLNGLYFGVPKTILGATFSYARQGERTLLSHDYTDSTIVVGPFPRGVVERAASLSVSARYQATAGFYVESQIGISHVTNVGHVSGRKKNFLNAGLNILYVWQKNLSI